MELSKIKKGMLIRGYGIVFDVGFDAGFHNGFFIRYLDGKDFYKGAVSRKVKSGQDFIEEHPVGSEQYRQIVSVALSALAKNVSDRTEEMNIINAFLEQEGTG